MFRQLLETGAETMAVDKGFPNEQIRLDVTKFDIVNHEHYPQLENIDAVLLTGSSTFVHPLAAAETPADRATRI